MDQKEDESLDMMQTIVEIVFKNYAVVSRILRKVTKSIKVNGKTKTQLNSREDIKWRGIRIIYQSKGSRKKTKGKECETEKMRKQRDMEHVKV